MKSRTSHFEEHWNAVVNVAKNCHQDEEEDTFHRSRRNQVVEAEATTCCCGGTRERVYSASQSQRLRISSNRTDL